MIAHPIVGLIFMVAALVGLVSALVAFFGMWRDCEWLVTAALRGLCVAAVVLAFLLAGGLIEAIITLIVELGGML